MQAAMMETPTHRNPKRSSAAAALDALKSVPKLKRESRHSMGSVKSEVTDDSKGNVAEYWDIPPPSPSARSPTEEIGDFAIGHEERAAFEDAVEAQQKRRTTEIRSRRSVAGFLRNQRDRRSFERRQEPEVNFSQPSAQKWYYDRDDLPAEVRAFNAAKDYAAFIMTH